MDGLGDDIRSFGFWIFDFGWRMLRRLAPAPVPVRVRQAARIFWLGCAASALLNLSTSASAELAGGQDEQVAYKTMTGKVSGVGASGKFLAVEYRHDPGAGMSYEMAFPLDEKAQLSHVKSLKELHLGDAVTVEYREVTFKDEQKQLKTRRVATKVELVKSAPTEPPDSPAASTQ